MSFDSRLLGSLQLTGPVGLPQILIPHTSSGSGIALVHANPNKPHDDQEYANLSADDLLPCHAPITIQEPDPRLCIGIRFQPKGHKATVVAGIAIVVVHAVVGHVVVVVNILFISTTRIVPPAIIGRASSNMSTGRAEGLLLEGIVWLLG